MRILRKTWCLACYIFVLWLLMHVLDIQSRIPQTRTIMIRQPPKRGGVSRVATLSHLAVITLFPITVLCEVTWSELLPTEIYASSLNILQVPTDCHWYIVWMLHTKTVTANSICVKGNAKSASNKACHVLSAARKTLNTVQSIDLFYTRS